jgi:hypothetical protein
MKSSTIVLTKEEEDAMFAVNEAGRTIAKVATITTATGWLATASLALGILLLSGDPCENVEES